MERIDDIDALVATIMGSIRTELASNRVTKAINVTLSRDTESVRRRVVVRYARNQGPSHLAAVRRQFVDQLRLPRDRRYAVGVVRGGNVFAMPTLDPDLFENDDSVLIAEASCDPHEVIDETIEIALDTSADANEETAKRTPEPNATSPSV